MTDTAQNVSIAGMSVWRFLRELVRLEPHEVALVALLILCGFAMVDEFLRWLGSP